MGNDRVIYIFVFVIAAVVLARLDRLGKQLEAVCAEIRADVARTEEGRSPSAPALQIALSIRRQIVVVAQGVLDMECRASRCVGISCARG